MSKPLPDYMSIGQITDELRRRKVKTPQGAIEVHQVKYQLEVLLKAGTISCERVGLVRAFPCDAVDAVQARLAAA